MYFAPWNKTKLTHSAKNAYPHWLKPEKLYRHNYLPVDIEWFKTIIKNANFKKYGKTNKAAIILEHTELRTLPLLQPLFKNATIAGEGYPFAYIQGDYLTCGTPVRVSHFSKDKAWAFVDTASNSFGWIDARRVAYIDKQHQKKYSNLPLTVIHTENKAVLSKSGSFIFSTRIGMIVPYMKKDKNFFTILYPAKNKKGYVSFAQTKISKQVASRFPLTLNKKNLTHVLNEFIGNIYCWGGQYAGRDCSGLTKDYSALFGFFLYRNSINQVKNGLTIDVSKLSDTEKLRVIKKRAVPFATLFYFPGHVVLYTGKYNNEPIILHNTWAVKTRNGDETGRNIIGKTVLTTLKPGIELKTFDRKKGTLLKQLKAIVLLNMPLNPDFEFNLAK
jgi:cell wall-associated NlpC family hydrolase